jgi:ComF family protein
MYDFFPQFSLRAKTTLMIFQTVINMVLPPLCTACNRLLVNGERILCLKCRYDMPRTRYHSYADNPVARLFWGKIPVRNAASYFRYHTGSRFQNLIHQLKYHGRQEIGTEIGMLMGLEFKGSSFEDADLILPVPLHRKRQRKRGYNQSDPIARGISKTLGRPFSSGWLERTLSTRTQTDKSRLDRYLNVEGVFSVKYPELIAYKHILLVDDVITTGSTLIACAEEILHIEGTEISIATLAVAPKSF